MANSVEAHPGSTPRIVSSDCEEDALLVKRTAEGDEDAFNRLARKYSSRIRVLAFKYTGDGEVANEVVTEVLLRVYRASHLYRKEASFYNWLARIVFNCCIDARRQERRRRTINFDESYGSSCEAMNDLEDPCWEKPFTDAMGNTLQYEILTSLISQMDEPKRDLLMLSHNEDMGYDEIGKRLSMPIGTVKSKLFRARAELRHEFAIASDDVNAIE